MVEGVPIQYSAGANHWVPNGQCNFYVGSATNVQVLGDGNLMGGTDASTHIYFFWVSNALTDITLNANILGNGTGASSIDDVLTAGSYKQIRVFANVAGLMSWGNYNTNAASVFEWRLLPFEGYYQHIDLPGTNRWYESHVDFSALDENIFGALEFYGGSFFDGAGPQSLNGGTISLFGTRVFTDDIYTSFLYAPIYTNYPYATNIHGFWFDGNDDKLVANNKLQVANQHGTAKLELTSRSGNGTLATNTVSYDGTNNRVAFSAPIYGNASGISNAVDIIAGSNVTVTTNSGRSFTIAATGGGSVTITNTTASAGVVTGGGSSYGIGTNVGVNLTITNNVNFNGWSATNVLSVRGEDDDADYSAGRITFAAASATGDIFITGGTNIAQGTSSAGGDINLIGGMGGTGSSTGGDVNITGGATGEGTGGSINIVPGAGNGVGDTPGEVNITGPVNVTGDLAISGAFQVDDLVAVNLTATNLYTLLTNKLLSTDANGKLVGVWNAPTNSAASNNIIRWTSATTTEFATPASGSSSTDVKGIFASGLSFSMVAAGTPYNIFGNFSTGAGAESVSLRSPGVGSYYSNIVFSIGVAGTGIGTGTNLQFHIFTNGVSAASCSIIGDGLNQKVYQVTNTTVGVPSGGNLISIVFSNNAASAVAISRYAWQWEIY